MGPLIAAVRLRTGTVSSVGRIHDVASDLSIRDSFGFVDHFSPEDFLMPVAYFRVWIRFGDGSTDRFSQDRR
jgi:hypothetical protein